MGARENKQLLQSAFAELAQGNGNNQYCYVIRFADGTMRELLEYFDTELVTTALQAPAQ